MKKGMLGYWPSLFDDFKSQILIKYPLRDSRQKFQIRARPAHIPYIINRMLCKIFFITLSVHLAGEGANDGTKKEIGCLHLLSKGPAYQFKQVICLASKIKDFAVISH